MTTYSDQTLITAISTALTNLQDAAVQRRLSGYTEFQSIVPSFTLSFKEYRKVTKRTRLKKAAIENFAAMLEEEGLEVEYELTSVDVGTFLITKPAQDIEMQHTRLANLLAAADKLTVEPNE